MSSTTDRIMCHSTLNVVFFIVACFPLGTVCFIWLISEFVLLQYVVTYV